VDRHIRRLDSDLAKYEDSLLLGLRDGTLPSHDAPAAGPKSPPGATTSLGAKLLGVHEGFEEDEEGDTEGGAPEGTGRKKKGKVSEAEREKEGEWKRRREVQKLEKKLGKQKAVEEPVAPVATLPIGMPSAFLVLFSSLSRLRIAELTPFSPLKVDPNEPVYCFCQRVAFGEMVGCDNDDCAREWVRLHALPHSLSLTVITRAVPPRLCRSRCRAGGIVVLRVML
jgi:hypothetical protein